MGLGPNFPACSGLGGLGPLANGLDWIGSHKLEPWTTLLEGQFRTCRITSRQTNGNSESDRARQIARTKSGQRQETPEFCQFLHARTGNCVRWQMKRGRTNRISFRSEVAKHCSLCATFRELQLSNVLPAFDLTLRTLPGIRNQT